ncbi:MAG: lysozyme inhibitor LprI family protein [Halomonas sp.]|uniref:lysozyme inhibitor LprI family protein n=1 Tax=Halomonas sp. TaxID=1486246 RepID=UPI002ACE9B59|nr:lysozyme inhibitor LprI family protein [Halomonas sp.]MDZ7852302.1 lysozyme inhibitor LprI family protein [Halomonas sp.]
MKRFIMMTLMFVAFGITGEAFADKWYVERPDFMSHDLPDYFPCEAGWPVSKKGDGTCLLQEGSERVVFSNGERTWVKTERQYMMTHCDDGVCEIFGGSGNYIGKSNHWGYLQIPRYYYIWGSEKVEEGTVRYHLYKRGTGPAADQFPGWRVENDTLPPKNLSSFLKAASSQDYRVSSVNCDERALTHGECEVTIRSSGPRAEADYVSEYFPFDQIFNEFHFFKEEDVNMQLDAPECYQGSCSDIRGNFRGLDPEFPLWQKEESTISRNGYLSAYDHVTGPSFRCSAATEPVEHMICRVPKLSKADGIMGEIYQDLYRAVNSSEADRIKSDQSQWIKERDRVCPVDNQDLESPSRLKIFSECVMEQIELRSEELWSELNETIR